MTSKLNLRKFPGERSILFILSPFKGAELEILLLLILQLHALFPWQQLPKNAFVFSFQMLPDTDGLLSIKVPLVELDF